MSVLPLYIEIERPRPVFEHCLHHRDLLPGLVLPAILAAQRRRRNELQNKDGASREETKADENRVKSRNDDSAGRRLSQEIKEEASTALLRSDAGKFEVSLDIQHFSPEELSVKTADRYIVVEGKHEEKQDEHGYISRQFVRRYALPEGCHPDTVQSRLSSDGMLTITAPKMPQLALEGGRAVPIVHTGPVRVTPSTSQQQQENVQQ